MNSPISNPTATTAQAQPEVDVISIGDLVDVMLGARWLIAGITAASLALGAAYTWVATPVYEADSLLQVEKKQSGLGGLDFGDLLGGETSTAAEIELLRSRMVLGKAVDRLKLDIVARPQHFTPIGAAMARHHDAASGFAAPWLSLNDYAWGGESIQVDTLEVPAQLLGADLRLVAGEAGHYSVRTAEGRHLLDGIVGELATGAEPDPMRLFVATLQARPGTGFLLQRQHRLTVIAELQRSISVKERGKNTGVLSIKLTGNDPVRVRTIVNEVTNLYFRQNVERKSAEAEKTLAFLDQQLPQIKRQMEAAEATLNSYRLDQGSIDLPMETQTLLAQIVAAEEAMLRLRHEREMLLDLYTDAHPLVIALDEQIARAKSNAAQLEAQAQKLPGTQQDVLRLHRDVQVSTELYTALLNSAQELRVVKAGTVGNVRVIDYAETPYLSVKPEKTLIVMLATLLGLFAGVVAAFVRKALRGGVEDPDQAEKQLGVPVYAVIGHSRKQDKLEREHKAGASGHNILALVDSHDLAIESLRNLRTALHFGMMDVQNNIVMIAGPSPSIGKSFVSCNFAAVLAANDKKVLLIDGDLRRGHLHKNFGLHRENGLSELVTGDIPRETAIQKTLVPNLDIVTTGTLPPNPSELLLHDNFSDFLKHVTDAYDHVIIDSPPILAVTDASIIGQLAGATLMVLKSGVHPMREIEASVKRLQQANVNLRGLLFNDIRLTSKRYGAGRYSYQYAYTK